MSAKPEMSIKAFYDQQTNTVSYVVSDDKTRSAAIIDPVLGIDYAAGQLSYAEADVIVDYVKSTGLQVAWLIETHVHADHLSASPYLQSLLGGKIAISEKIVEVQNVLAKCLMPAPLLSAMAVNLIISLQIMRPTRLGN